MEAPPPPPPPPPPRKGNLAAIALVVAIAALAAAVLVPLALLAPGGAPPAVAPVLALTAHTSVGDDWSFGVQAVDRPEGFAKYGIAVLRGTTPALGPADLAPGAPFLGTPATLHLNVTDQDGSGTLTGGDTFVLGNTAADTTYHVVFTWKATGTEIARKTITTSSPPPPPQMSFTSTSVQPGGGGDDWEFRIASIDQSFGFGSYRIAVLDGASTVLGPTDLAPAAPLLGGPTTLHLNVTDLDGGGRLSGGDTFVLGNTQPGRTYQVVFFWKATGSEIARKWIST